MPTQKLAQRLGFFLLIILSALQAHAQDAPGQILITNVSIFDGRSDQLAENQSLLIEGNLIKAIGTELAAHDGATVIDGKGGTLMPGLHDMHVHLSILLPSDLVRARIEPWRTAALGQVRAQNILMRGFTTVRDTGGASVHIKKNIDAGITHGPRVFSAEGMISQTGGHGDFRARNDAHPNLVSGGDVSEYDKLFYIADTPGEVRRAVRMSLKRGATSIKMFTSGGHSSEFDPLYQEAFTLEELKAGVEAAAAQDTYVSTHTFTPLGVQKALDAGVKDLLHLAYIDEETAIKVAESGVWTNPGPFEVIFGGEGIEYYRDVNPVTYAKLVRVSESMDNNMKWLVKHGAKMYFGTDLVAPIEAYPERDAQMNNEFRHLVKYVSNVEALRMATSYAAQANLMSGKNHPYQEGALGVIEEGAYADILILAGNPLVDIEVMTDVENNYQLIMKDGVTYKNTL